MLGIRHIGRSVWGTPVVDPKLIFSVQNAHWGTLEAAQENVIKKWVTMGIACFSYENAH